jgi:hypothetical protein
VQIRKQWRDKEIFRKGKPKNDKRMLDKSVDGRDQKKPDYVLYSNSKRPEADAEIFPDFRFS